MEFLWRCIFFLAGVITLAFGVSLTIKGQLLGIGSWDVLHVGLTNTIGLTVGTWSIILGIAILLFISLVTKKLPQLGTWVDMVLTGIFIDIFNWLLPSAESITMQALSFLLGLFAIGYGCGMYITADLGVGPRDALMMLATERTKLSVRTARTIMEISVALLGFLLGGPIGIGTIIMAVSLGPIVQNALQLNERLFQKCVARTKHEQLS